MATKRQRHVVRSGGAARELPAVVESVSGELVPVEYQGQRFICPETGRDLTAIDIFKHIETLWPYIDERQTSNKGAMARRAQLREMAQAQAEDWAKFGVPGVEVERGD